MNQSAPNLLKGKAKGGIVVHYKHISPLNVSKMILHCTSYSSKLVTQSKHGKNQADYSIKCVL